MTEHGQVPLDPLKLKTTMIVINAIIVVIPKIPNKTFLVFLFLNSFISESIIFKNHLKS